MYEPGTFFAFKDYLRKLGDCWRTKAEILMGNRKVKQAYAFAADNEDNISPILAMSHGAWS